ncbi:MAG TPA: cupin domain-containing protein [Candidatus Baltobacteraceae bacterium]|nr:cupin domain-containing protein [Candidatus Baltobacteraceae bacterium]
MDDDTFTVLDTQGDVQTAVMRLRRAEASGPLGNEHASSSQVIVVIRGTIEAEIGDQKFRMGEGDSAIVPRGVAHRFVGVSNEAVTLNVYSPPAYGRRR